ncbi:MAG: YlbF family regulator [Anaerolineae bacterium]|nr:YlbF family regulator [Anaerolineae bacterium]
MLDPELEAAARQFAARLAQTPPLAELRRVQEQLQADAEAQRLLAEWDEKQQELLARQRAGQTIAPAEIEALRRLRVRIYNYPTIRAYSEIQRQVQPYLTDLNMEISQVLGLDFAALSRAVGE